jgi:Type II intron maturase/Reverse transcriptase (RNA-dependent DNA polymerase)
VLSPLLANIYLDRLDRFVEQALVPEFNRGQVRRKKPEYRHLDYELRKLIAKGADEATLRPIRKELKRIGHGDPFDPAYRRLRYIRYADDFLLGFAGPRAEAEEIKDRIGTFLRDSLKLEMSPEKTLITHAGTEKARFLGYDIGVDNSPEAGKGKGKTKLRIPPMKLENKVAKYMRDGKPTERPELLHDDDFTIVSKYGSEFQGFVQYYAYAENRFWLSHLRWVMGTSLLKTLAAKHKSTVSKMARCYNAETHHRGRTLRCLQVVRE